MRRPIAVVTPGATISYCGGQVIIREHRSTSSKCVPIRTVSALLCYGPQNLSPGFIEVALRCSIPVCLFSTMGRFIGSLMPICNNSANLAERQVKVTFDPLKAVILASHLICAKLREMIRLNDRIRAIAKTENDIERVMTNHGRIQGLISNLSSGHKFSITNLLGIEGIASQLHYSDLRLAIKNNNIGESFKSRTRRPPRDPFNSLLSFLYSLLLGEAFVAVCSSGLDPKFGVLHSARTKPKPALALDLMEPFRVSIAHRIALRVINLRMIDESHFTISKEGCFLNRDGRRIVAAELCRVMANTSTSAGRSKIHSSAQRLRTLFENA